ncbi:MAG: site-specific integrase [Deltaproteobacteria bacterium]|nr:site-specific integrase [Deltaproteobacteria bacterium]
MAIKWIKTAHKGLRYYEHLTRRHGKKRDRYYAIRFKVAGKDYGYGVGWWSDGIPEEIEKEDPDLGFEEYALKLLRQYQGNIKAGSGPKSPKEKRKIAQGEEAQAKAEQERLAKEAVTFDAFFNDTYLPQAKADKKPRSVTREEGLYGKWIKDVIGQFPMKDIAPFHLEKLKKVMADGKQAPRSIEYALAVIRQMFNTAKRLGVYGGESPTAKVKAPKVDNGRMRFLTREEATALLDALKAKKSTDVYDMTLLSLHAGLRFGEIASLTWQDMDLSKGVLTIRDAKAGSRYAFLTEQAATMLEARDKARKGRKPADYVFQGRKVKLDRISITFARTVEELKLNDGIDDPRLKICFHSCRHSYASWLIEQGADLYTVQKLLGHKTNVMTQRYAHLSENRLKDAAKALGAAWQIQGGKEEDQKEVEECPAVHSIKGKK